MTDRLPLCRVAGRTVELPAGDGIAASAFPALKGGATGYVLTKLSGSDYDFTWSAPATGGGGGGGGVTAAQARSIARRAAIRFGVR
jgi:hypothetical protein